MYFLILIVFIWGTQSTACSKPSDCLNVSASPRFVACESNLCVCSPNGFIGSAIATDKCRCPPSNEVITQRSIEYCLGLDESVIAVKNDMDNQRHASYLRLLYNALTGNNPRIVLAALATGASHPVISLFDVDAKGRIDPLGQWVGFINLIEYYFSSLVTGFVQVPSVNIKKLVCDNYICGIDVDILFYAFNQTGAIVDTYNLTQTGFYTINKTSDKITLVDVIIRNLGAAVNASGLDFSTPLGIGLTCQLILAAGCNSVNDPDGYYTNMTDCIDYHTNHIDSGSMGNAYFNGNSTACHYVHANFAFVDPINHCKHAGKTGGGKCINHEYKSFYTESF